MIPAVVLACSLSVLLHGVFGCYVKDSFVQEVGFKNAIIFQGVAKSFGKQIVCEENGKVKLIKSNGRLISHLENDIAVVSVQCQVHGSTQCSSEDSQECEVYITGLNQLAQQNCGDIPLQINKNYIVYGIVDEKFKGCRGVYQAKDAMILSDPIEKDDQGRCLKQESELKIEQRRLLQDKDQNNSKAQCGLFGVDITYCAPEGLVTDQASAKVVMACDKSVSGICSECLKVEGPKNGTVQYVIPLKETGNHHEIKFSWEENYLGPVVLTTEECDLVDNTLQQMISPITPMKFTRVPFVMVKPSGYAIH